MRRIPLGQIIALSLTAGTALGAAVIAVEAWLAARRHYLSMATAPPPDWEFGTGTEVVRITLLGDALAAGVGVRDVADTVGGQLARQVSASGRRIRISSTAVGGSGTGDLGPQVSRALLGSRPDVAVVLVGADDVTAFRRLAAIRRNLAEAVTRLRAAGVRVVVGTCPDLGAVRAVAQPLRTLLGWRARSMAAAQRQATLSAGGVPVDLAARTGQVFRADPGTFSQDGYHPSADGYRLIAEALLPAVAEAAGAPAPR